MQLEMLTSCVLVTFFLIDNFNLALESAHRGWGQSCVIGVAASGKLIKLKILKKMKDMK